ncbi:MAG: hypothetical protein ACR2FV_11680 [Ornithinimicrobium sp.]|uniref:hypothetical protein n=1 Tax=Ornithinimicrobium sp. TaxID=1977084 RepID=UPI003D9BFA06
MVLVSSGDAVSAGASQLLRRLLTDEETYRRWWLPYAQRRRGEELHLGAVAAVLATYLGDIGELRQDQQGRARVPRSLSDAVSRALLGRLSMRYLEWFVAAFEIRPEHRDELWVTFAGDQGAPGLTRAAAGDAPPTGGRGYRTVSLEDLHVVGADRVPQTHRTVQVVRALDPLRSYHLRFDTAALMVDVVRGGRPSAVYEADQPGVWATDIHLHDTVAPGETAVVEYCTVFGYPEPPPPLFRRAFSRTVGSVDLQVRFHPAQLPQHVWRATWEGWADPPIELVRQEVGADHTVHWSGTQVQETMIGFTWVW